MVKSPKKGKKANQNTKQTLLTSPGMSGSPARNTRAATTAVAKSSPLRAPPPSTMVHSSQVFGSARKGRKAAVIDTSSSEDEMSEDEDEEVLKSPVTKKKKRGVYDEDDEDDEDEVLKLPVTKTKKRGIYDEDDDDDDDDKPLVTPTPKRRRPVVLDDSDDAPRASSPIKRRRLVRGNTASSPAKRGVEQEDENDEIVAPSSTARAGRAGRKPMTKKEKARELLRRKRAGEVIDEEDQEESSEDEEPVRAMYDTDSDLPALNEFDDDEEDVPDNKASKKKGKGKSKDDKKKKSSGDAGSDDESLEDFIDDDSDAALGVPEEAYLNIPLEFTAHAHKPLKEHFRDAIEWLVQFKLDPGSADRDHALYRLAWKKLDAEVHGLATSKFASSSWKKDFYLALRARPFVTSQDLRAAGGAAYLGTSCEACGRTGHPAT